MHDATGSITGWVDARPFVLSAAELDRRLRALEPHDVPATAFQGPTTRQLRMTRRVLTTVEPGLECAAIQLLADASLRDICQFLIGCRDLSMVFLGADAAGLHVQCVGGVEDVRAVIADAISMKSARLPLLEWCQLELAANPRTEDRLDRTFDANEQLLERLADREDVAFAAAWRVTGGAAAFVAHSFQVPLDTARKHLVEFDRRVLAGRFTTSPSQTAE